MNIESNPPESFGKALIRELVKFVVPAANGLDGLDSPAERVAAAYSLPNPQFLANIMGVIQSYRMLYEDGPAMDQAARVKLAKIRNRLINIKKACAEIKALASPGGLGGALVALDRDHNMFHDLELHTAVCAFAITDVGPITDPHDAVLGAFVLALGEYWFDGNGAIPEGQFGVASELFAPVPGTAAAFVVEALAETGWFFTGERVVAAFAAMQRNLISRFSADDEGDNDEENTKQTH